jgi:spore coat polysaccharide biosynthesis protein SpsF
MSLGKVGIVVAARSGSRRLPGKALLPLRGVPMIAFLLRRLKPTRRAVLIVATTDLAADDALARVAAEEGVAVVRGASEDVVARYVAAAEQFALETVVRITADCPFVNAELVDFCLDRAAEAGTFDLFTTKTRFPVGLDAEIYRAEHMAVLHRRGELTATEREHLTLCYYNHSDSYAIRYVDPLPPWRLMGAHFTVDTAADYAQALRTATELPAADASLAALLQIARRQMPDDGQSMGAEEISGADRR